MKRMIFYILFPILFIILTSYILIFIREKKTLIVAIEKLPNEPFSFYENDNLVGFDIDLSKKIAEELNYDIIYKHLAIVDSTKALREQNNNLFDIALNLNMSDDRKDISFTNPYISDRYVMVKSVNNNTIKNISDIEGKNILVIDGTKSVKIAESIADREKISKFNNGEEAILYLVSNEEKLFIVSEIYIKNYMKNNPNTIKIIAPITKNIDQIAIGVSKNKFDLLNKINNSLQRLIQDGVYDEIYNKWFLE